jgi:hypothetical protein
MTSVITLLRKPESCETMTEGGHQYKAEIRLADANLLDVQVLSDVR